MIKRNVDSVKSPRIICSEIRKASEESKRIIKTANNKADEILSDARCEARNIYIRERERAIEAANKQIAGLMVRANARRSELEKKLEKDMIELVIQVAESIVFDQLKIHPELVLTRIREGFNILCNHRKLYLRINPDDAETFNEEILSLKNCMTAMSELSVIKDCSLARGSVFISSETENVDLSVTTGLEIIKETLLKSAN